MDEGDIEHRTEIRGGRRTWAILACVIVLGLVAAIVLAGGGDEEGDRTDAGPTAADADPTTTPAAEDPPGILVLADSETGPVAARTDEEELGRGDPSTAFEAIQAPAVSTGDWVVALVDGGTLLAGEPGGPMRAIGPDTQVSRLVASDRPGHVWAGIAEGALGLVDVASGDVVAKLGVGPGRVVGPAADGVVVAEPEGGASYRRLGADPEPVPLPVAEVAIDAGAGLVLTEGPADGAEGARRFHVRSLDGTVVRSFGVPTSSRPGALATDGSVVALPTPDGWVVRATLSAEALGSLPPEPGDATWIGDGRFAVYSLGAVELSDGTRLDPAWLVRSLVDRGD